MSPLPVITSRLLEVAGVRHAFFTRQGGVSEGIYASLNVGLGSGDDPDAVRENRRRCAGFFDEADIVTAYGIELEKLAEAGCRYVQLDETSIAKLGDEKIRNALAARGDHWEELRTGHLVARSGGVS